MYIFFFSIIIFLFLYIASTVTHILFIAQKSMTIWCILILFSETPQNTRLWNNLSVTLVTSGVQLIRWCHGWLPLFIRSDNTWYSLFIAIDFCHPWHPCGMPSVSHPCYHATTYCQHQSAFTCRAGSTFKRAIIKTKARSTVPVRKPQITPDQIVHAPFRVALLPTLILLAHVNVARAALLVCVKRIRWWSKKGEGGWIGKVFFLPAKLDRNATIGKGDWKILPKTSTH